MERSFDSAYVRGDSPERKEIILNLVLEKFMVPEKLDVRELEKTEHEILLIDQTVKAVKAVLKDFGFEDRGVPVENIHILDEEEFKSLGKEAAFYTRRHVYLKRDVSNDKFLHDLSHELSHLVSASVVGLYDLSEIVMTQRRVGIRFEGYNKTKSDFEYSFSGLNEAYTELFSSLVKARLEGLSGISEDIELLVKMRAYWQQVAILSSLIYMQSFYDKEVETIARQINEIAKDNGSLSETERIELGRLKDKYNDRVKAFHNSIIGMIINDYLKGEYNFVKLMESQHKGTAKILAEMDTTPEGAAEAAEKLRFNFLAKKIRENDPLNVDFNFGFYRRQL